MFFLLTHTKSPTNHHPNA